MMELFESLESSLGHLVILTKFVLESISVFCVILGLVQTIQLTMSIRRSPSSIRFPFNQIRLQFGVWLALALEFQLGADIVATTVAPTLESLGELALIAVIRTFLNYFLSKELEAEIAMKKEELEISRNI